VRDNNSTENTWIIESSPDGNQGTGDIFVTASPVAARSGLIRFTPNQDLGSVLVLDATVSLYAWSVLGTIDVGAYRCLQDWEELEATWNSLDSTSLWNTPGAEAADDSAGEDSTADRRLTLLDTVTISGGGRHAWNVTPLVQEWLDGTSSEYGIVLVGTGVFVQAAFSGRTYWQDARRPYLSITYQNL